MTKKNSPTDSSKPRLVTTLTDERRHELVEGLVSRRIKFHQLPAEVSARDATTIRRQALERMADTKLPHIGHYSYDVESASRRNCENSIGVAQIPMGVVGPLLLKGDYVDEEVFVPLATTEGALVASTNRGCAAIRAAGGAKVYVEDVGMTRAPVFRTNSLAESKEFLAWIKGHERDIRRVTESTSRFLRLADIKPYAFGTTVFLRFRFETGDAMGMNMVTIATDRAVRQLIEPQTGIPCIALSGNYCVDKKPAAINVQEGRGKRIHAEVVLDKHILQDYLKTNPATLLEVQYRKNILGSIAAGAGGFNAHFANPLAAFYIATGQDLAHVVGGSQGVTCIERRGPDQIYFSIFLPDAPVGAIGGGTALDTQSEALSLMKIELEPEYPGAAARRLAEILAGVVLASELSLMSAFTSNSLADAHERLGRDSAPS